MTQVTICPGSLQLTRPWPGAREMCPVCQQLVEILGERFRFHKVEGNDDHQGRS
jgi:hypothetical protein